MTHLIHAAVGCLALCTTLVAAQRPAGGSVPLTPDPANSANAPVIGTDAFIGGGRRNQAPGARSVVTGGYGNMARGSGASISGGERNRAVGSNATISGGYGNLAGASSGGAFSTVSGGVFNEADGLEATVAGGRENVATSHAASIGGGFDNLARGSFAHVGGGFGNVSDSYGTVGGGAYNVAGGADNTVAGGRRNRAIGFSFSSVGGGFYNTASHSYAVVSGGSDNEASGRFSMVPGGRLNEAFGEYSFAAGLKAKAEHAGSFVWADSVSVDKGSSANDEFNVYAGGGARIFSASDGTTGVLLAPGGGSWTSVSDRDAKENFEPVDCVEVLDRIAAIPVSTWNYKAQDDSIRHMGPMAQDFYAAFGLGLGDRSIDTIDPDGVALAAIQGLHSENAALRGAVEALSEELAALKALVTSIDR